MNDSSVARNLAFVAGAIPLDIDCVLTALGPERGMLYYHLLLARLDARGEIGRASHGLEELTDVTVTNVPPRVISPKPSVTMGVLLIVLAFLCVAVMSAFAKAATGIATGTLVFFQNAIALLLFAPWALSGGFLR